MIFNRNELCLFILWDLKKGESLTSRDLAKRIRGEEGKGIRDQRMVMDVTREQSREAA